MKSIETKVDKAAEVDKIVKRLKEQIKMSPSKTVDIDKKHKYAKQIKERFISDYGINNVNIIENTEAYHIHILNL